MDASSKALEKAELALQVVKTRARAPPQASPPSITLGGFSEVALARLLDCLPGPFQEQDSFQQLKATL
eukprot:3028587-Prorocentrum_lima.AAC.1